MEACYVFLNLKPDMKKYVITKIKVIDEAKEAHLVIGIFDAIARIEAESIQELQDVYFNKIDKINGVINSRLYIVACPRSRK